MNQQISMMNMMAGNQKMSQANMNEGMNDMGMQMNGIMDGSRNDMSMNGNMCYCNGGYWQFEAEDNICVTNNIKFDVNEYTTTLTPTTYTPSKYDNYISTSTLLHAANSLLKIINFDLEDIK